MSERKKPSRSSSQYAPSSTGTNGGVPKKPSRSLSLKNNQKPPEEKLTQRFNKALNQFFKAQEDEKKLPSIREMQKVIESAWNIPLTGRDFAYDLCDVLKREHVLDYLVTKLKVDANRGNKPLLRDIQQDCAGLLERILTPDNRHYVARNYLETIVNYTKSHDDIDQIRINTGILEALFKDSESTCLRLIDFGSLDAILYACRYDDMWTARHCAAAIGHATIFGGTVIHRKLVSKGVAEWLFPLAFRDDNECQFYACLAICVLASNQLVENAVIASGTLKLVEPFVKSNDPYEFSMSNSSHSQGRTASFLQRIIPLLLAGEPEPQAFAAFYFAMEASIKAKQQKMQIFQEIAAIVPLKRVVATSRSTIARSLASRCMKIIGEEIPKKLSTQVHLWDVEDVQSWLTIAGFRAFHKAFLESAVDGEMLLLLTENELMKDLNMSNTVHRKRFIRDLNRLRSGADYRSCDPSNICDWLRRVDPQFAQYTLPLVRAGIDRNFLSLLNDEHLKIDCGVMNGVHRTRILDAVKKIGTDNQYSITEEGTHANCDVFVSYRRKNASHLASLVKVHLQLLGYKVFICMDHDGDDGQSIDYTLRSAKHAKVGFIVILTPGSLDKCAIDHEMLDDMHKEIVTALSNRSIIVPVTTEGFQWPMPDQLPSDMKKICFFNGVKWAHDYQDACVDKIDKLLKGAAKPMGAVSRGQSMYGSRDLLNRSASTVKSRNPQPTQVVRPSGSTDNLDASDRLPRPHQRASPPGQDSHLVGLPTKASSPQSSSSRDIAGSVRDSTRRLDQADGASSVPQYPPRKKVPSITGKTDTNSSQQPNQNGINASNISLASKTSSHSIKKEEVKLEHVIKRNLETSVDSDIRETSSSSSEYTSSSEESDEEISAKEQRSGADGKSHPQEEKKQHAVVKSPSDFEVRKLPGVGDSKVYESSVSPISSIVKTEVSKSTSDFEAGKLPRVYDSTVSESSVSLISSIGGRRPSTKKYHAPMPPKSDATGSEGFSTPDFKRKKVVETSVDSPDEEDVAMEKKHEEEEESSTTSEESSSGEEEFHSTTHSIEDVRIVTNKPPIEVITESSEKESSSEESEEEEDESDQETVTGQNGDKEETKSDKEETASEDTISEHDKNEAKSDEEVYENTDTLPHDSNKRDSKLSESDISSEESLSSVNQSSEEESENDDSRANGDGVDGEDDIKKKYITTSESESNHSRTVSSSTPSELDVEPMKVLNVPSANSNNSNNLPRRSVTSSESDSNRSPMRRRPDANKLVARVDIAPTKTELQYSPRRSPQKLITHPSRIAQHSPRTPPPAYMQPGIPPFQSSHKPQHNPQQSQYNHPSQGYPYNKPITSASLNALYPPHPSMQQPVKRTSSRGSLGSNTPAGSRLVTHHPTHGFDTAV